MTAGLTFYLAARYTRREELHACRTDLELRGHRVPARWLLGDHHYEPADLREWEAGSAGDLAVAARFASDDVEDVAAADVVVCFTEQPRTAGGSRGGRHVEFGLALGLRLAGPLYDWPRLYVVGPVENVFHAHPAVDGGARSWVRFLDLLDAQPAIHGWGRDGECRCDLHPWHRTNAYHEAFYRQETRR